MDAGNSAAINMKDAHGVAAADANKISYHLPSHGRINCCCIFLLNASGAAGAADDHSICSYEYVLNVSWWSLKYQLLVVQATTVEAAGAQDHGSTQLMGASSCLW